MTLRDIKLGVLRYYQMRGLPLTFSKYKRVVADAAYLETKETE